MGGNLWNGGGCLYNELSVMLLGYKAISCRFFQTPNFKTLASTYGRFSRTLERLS